MTTTATSAVTGPLTANGVAPLPFNFQSISADEIGVTRNGLEVTTGFTVTRNDDGTGQVTPTSSWGNDIVYIYSKPNFNMPDDFARFRPVFPDVVEAALDRQARQIIALKSSVSRFGLAPGAPISNRVAGWDASGNPVSFPFSTFAGVKGDPGPPGSGGAGLNVKDYLPSSGRIPFVTDDITYFEACRDAILTLTEKASGAGVFQGKLSMYVPKGHYHCSRALDMKGIRIVGDFASPDGGGGGTVIRFSNDAEHGIIMSGGIDNTAPICENITIWGPAVKVDGTGAITNYAGATAATVGHGFVLANDWAACTNCTAAFFGGDLFHGVSFESYGHGNTLQLLRCSGIYGGRYAFYLQGADENAGNVFGCSAISCAGGGFNDSSFLGNNFYGNHVRDCGSVNPIYAGGPVGTCVYGGGHWYVAPGKATLASTEAPGTGTQTAWIRKDNVGAATPWTSGRTWLYPYPYFTLFGNDNNRSVFIGNYSESAQAPMAIYGPSVVIGGLWEEVGCVPGSVQPVTGGRGGALSVRGILVYDVNATVNKQTIVGDVSGLSLHGSDTILQHYDGADNFVLWRSATQTLAFDIAGGTVFQFTTAGIELNNGKVLKIGGTQVVAQRDTGWTAATGTALKGAFASYGAGALLTFSATYTKSELDTLATRLKATEDALQATSQRVVALEQALRAHGLIN